MSRTLQLHLLVVCGVAMVACRGTTPPSGDRPAQPVKLILDTDMDTDVDDVGAVALLHALADRGEISILATVSSSKLPAAPACIDALNTFYGRPDLPVGAPKGEASSTARGTRYADKIAAEYPHDLQPDRVPDAMDVYRSVLAAADDGSVVIATVGEMTNLADLLRSGPDAHSPLTGVELVRRKVKEVSCMGGRFPRDTGSTESGNFRPHASATKQFVEQWPTRIMFSGDELGERVMTGERARAELPEKHPLRRAYDLFLGATPERPSWDQVAVLYAARGLGAHFRAHEKGYNAIVEHGNNEWRDTPDLWNHAYLVLKATPEQVANVIEELMITARARPAGGNASPPP